MQDLLVLVCGAGRSRQPFELFPESGELAGVLAALVAQCAALVLGPRPACATQNRTSESADVRQSCSTC
ncbi:hypothetical protein [Streptomyces sp. NPDC018045]|uniref:hypothetical protein n=1 Tax=Streptomyces sp. NPDC018045 TaxID=3365037 RepID=UPI0037A6D5F7